VNASVALARLRKLGVDVIRTSDAAAALGQTPSAASMTLRRLGEAGHIVALRQGLWWLSEQVVPYRVPEHVSAPLDSYLSMHTALHLHGAIEQIPQVFYVASLGRNQRVTTAVGVYSFHHLTPSLFGGYEAMEGAKIATLEKALFDFAYLASGRSRLFTALPELELPRQLMRSRLWHWLSRIPSQRSRTLTERKLESFLGTRC
jgi:predicted transcriptional regulator of viral defense system